MASSAPLFNPALRKFWWSQENDEGEKIRFRILYGGRMSGKSWSAAEAAIVLCCMKKMRFLCLRMFQNRINDSVYSLLKDTIFKLGLSKQFKIRRDSITNLANGSEFKFYGCAKNIDEIKSFEKADICWFEESHNLTEIMFKIIRPTIMRNEGAEMWFTFNPRFASDYSWKRLVSNPLKGSVIRLVNYDENIFLSNTALQDIADEFEEDEESAKHIYLGVPLDDDDRVIIKRKWVMAAINAHEKIKVDFSGVGFIGFDVADAGEDFNATVVCNGSEIVHLDEWRGGEDGMIESAERAMETAKKYGLKRYRIAYDSIGVGAGIGSIFNDKRFFNHCDFNASSKVSNPTRQYSNSGIPNEEMFCNLKAQAWQLVADRFRNTYLHIEGKIKPKPHEMISINTKNIPDRLLNKLIDELCTPMRDVDNYGRTKVESKKDLAKRDIKSPNLADAFIMSCCQRIIKGGISLLDVLD